MLGERNAALSSQSLRVLYTHRTQGVGAEGAHVLGMYEAFADLGYFVAMDCLPGCNPAEKVSAAINAKVQNSEGAQNSEAKPGPTAKPVPSLIQRVYWFIADHAPQVMFEAVELAYNIPLFLRLGYRAWRFKPDIIYERYALNTVAPSLVAWLLGCKHVLEVNDSVVIERSRPLRLKQLATALERFALQRCKLAITITHQFRQLLQERFDLPNQRILVLTNGVSVRRFTGPFQREQRRASLGVTGKVLGSTGQFLPWHGLKELLEQVGPKAKTEDLFFAFVGDGPVRPELESTAKVLGCEDRLHITGMVPIPDVPHWLSSLDIAVIPRAASHASPMKLMEYMAMGLPIIAPELPSIRAAMPTDNLGFVFPADDMNAMRNAVEMALANPAEAKRRGEAAREYVLKHLTWTAHAREVLTRLGYDLSSQTELVVAPKVGLGPQGEQPQDLSGKLGAGSAGSAVNPSQSQQAAQ